MSGSVQERFWSYVDRSGECWEWQAARMWKGYGHFGYNGKVRRAHRVAYEFARGPIPPKAQVLHRCDNPSCVRPSHLFLGTNAENRRDSIAKGRQATGTRIAQSKLTDADYYEIIRLYADGARQRDLAERFGVDPSRISRIVNRRFSHQRLE